MGICLSNPVVQEEFLSVLRAKQAGCDILFVDLRSADDFSEKDMLPTAIHIEAKQLSSALDLDDEEFLRRYGHPKPDRDHTEIILYGASNVTAIFATNTCKSHGYRKASFFTGDWQRWAKNFNRRKSPPQCSMPSLSSTMNMPSTDNQESNISIAIMGDNVIRVQRSP